MDLGACLTLGSLPDCGKGFLIALVNSATPTQPAAPAAPSAAPVTGAPVPPAPAATPAPSAAESDPTRLEYYDRLASLALQGPAVAVPPPIAAPAAGLESPPVAPTATPPGTAPAPTPDPNAPAAPPVQTPGQEPADEPDTTPEEQATWTEGERKLHSALVKERTARKDAKNELKQTRESVDTLKQELDALKAKLNPNPQPPATPPAQPASAPGALGDCKTFEEVDARAMQATSTEALAERLQFSLVKQGAAPVVEALKQQGITQLNGMPVAEMSEEQLNGFLTSVKEGAKLTQLQAPQRKQQLHSTAIAWESAVKILPGLADAKSPTFARAQQALRDNPQLPTLGANWPVLLAKYLRGDEAPAAPAAAPVPIVQPQPAAPAAGRAAPAAPRIAAAPSGQPSELEKLSAKMSDGTATDAEVDRYAVLSLRSGSPAQA